MGLARSCLHLLECKGDASNLFYCNTYGENSPAGRKSRKESLPTLDPAQRPGFRATERQPRIVKERIYLALGRVRTHLPTDAGRPFLERSAVSGFVKITKVQVR